MSSGWTLYQDGVIISSTTNADMEFNGFVIPENIEKCHNCEYEIIWDDGSGNTAAYQFNVNNCIKDCACMCWSDDINCIENKYNYHIEANASSGNSIDGYSGACSGEIVSFSAYCENTDAFVKHGYWYMIDNNNNVIYNRASRIENYKFNKNIGNENQTYRISYYNECDEKARDVTYTVVANDDCKIAP